MGRFLKSCNSLRPKFRKISGCRERQIKLFENLGLGWIFHVLNHFPIALFIGIGAAEDLYLHELSHVTADGFSPDSQMIRQLRLQDVRVTLH
jgi:hypothetical protein